LKSFEAWLKKGGKSADYLIYTEMCVMMNVIIDCKNRVSVNIYHDCYFITVYTVSSLKKQLGTAKVKISEFNTADHVSV